MSDSDLSQSATRLQRGITSSVPAKRLEPLGFPFFLLLLYLVMEYARPVNPMGIPLVISILLFVWWLTLPDKTWSPQIRNFILLLGVIAAMGPFAVNSYSVWWSFRSMAVQLLCICVPLIQLTSSLRRAFAFVPCFLAVMAYVAIYGITHGGFGPGGHIGDENDLALALSMALPLSVGGFLLQVSRVRRILSFGCFALIIFATMVTFSRGGFLALGAVLIYSFSLIFKKKPRIGFLMVGVLALAGWLYSPPGYWEEIGTITQDSRDTDHGTGALRREYWAVARRMFLDNPVLGVGLGNFTWNVPDYQSTEQLERAGRSYAGNVAHSLYFTLLAELGIAGQIVFSLILYQAYKDTQVVLRRASGPRARPTKDNTLPLGENTQTHPQLLNMAACYAHAVRAGILGYLVGGAFLSVFGYPHIWLLVALAASLRKATELESARDHESSLP